MAMDVSSIDIESLFSRLSIKDLLKCKTILHNVIEREMVKDKSKVKSISANDYVTYHDNYVDPQGEQYQGLFEDIKRTKLPDLDSKSNNKVSNVWISTIDQPYSWVSKATNKTYSFDAQSFSEYPNIKKLCDQINQQNNSQLNSCLVTHYPSGKSSLQLHSDDEPNMDANQPISVLSLGTGRVVDFIKKYESSTADPDVSIEAKAGSMYTMLPSCQDFFRHRVNHDNNVKSWRVCLSFRRMLTMEELEANNTCVNIIKTTADHDIFDDINNTQPKMTNIPSNTQKDSEPRKDLNHSNWSNVENQKSKNTKMNRTRYDVEEHYGTTVLFGTSMSVHLKSNQLEGRYNNFVNLSKSGAKITDIQNLLDEFSFSHPLAGDVRQIIFNLGTNDLKLCRYKRNEKTNVFKYQEPVFNLIARARNLFPGAYIYIIPVLPMKNLYHYTVPNVLNFNNILENAAKKFGCMYVDCFRYFLTYDLFDIDKYLFCWDGIHLNSNGLNILGNRIYHIIYYPTYTNYISSLSDFC